MPSIINSDAVVCMDRQQFVELDQIFIDHCQAGEDRAWDELFLSYHPVVCAAIRAFLRSRNEELVDELAACVWNRLVEDDSRLLGKFCSARGVRLATFLGAVSRNVVRSYLRSERRRRKHETSPALNYQVNGKFVGSLSRPELEEFLQSLSTGERQFVKWCISRSATDGCFSGTPNYDYQLRHRSCKKLRKYLG